MDDPEREHLLRRLDETDRARRRWKVLALAGTPALALLLTIAAGNAVTGWLALRDMREQAMQAEEEARQEAEQKMRESNALRAAEEAQVRAEEALKQEPKVRTP